MPLFEWLVQEGIFSYLLEISLKFLQRSFLIRFPSAMTMKERENLVNILLPQKEPFFWYSAPLKGWNTCNLLLFQKRSPRICFNHKQNSISPIPQKAENISNIPQYRSIIKSKKTELTYHHILLAWVHTSSEQHRRRQIDVIFETRDLG